MLTDTRESWLAAATECIGREIAERSEHRMPRIRVTCGFPHRGGIGRSRKSGRVIGECWPPQLAADKTYHQVSITPLLDEPVEVLAVLVHEIVHATVGCDKGHGPAFKALATTMGLEGKMTATRPSDDAVAWLDSLARWLGPFPHAALDPWTAELGPDNPDDRGKGGIKRGPWSPDTPRKQPARLMKVECPECGYLARVTRKWLESVGAPFCPCRPDDHARMVEA